MTSIPQSLILVTVIGGVLLLWGRTGTLRTAIQPTGLTALFVAALLHWLQYHSSLTVLAVTTAPPSGDAFDAILWRLAVWIGCGLGAALLLIDSDREHDGTGLILIAAAGVGAIASCDSVIWLIVGLQAVSFSSIRLNRADGTGDAASSGPIDSLLFPATCQALFIIGLSLLFAQTGTLSLAEMRVRIPEAINHGDTAVLNTTGPAIATSVLIVTGLFGLVCSLWLPWETTRRAVDARCRACAAISLLPTTAVLLIMLRLFPGLLCAWDAEVVTFVMIASLLLMAIGLLGVWLQSSLRGMLGWASIVHAGLWCAALTGACWDANHPDWSLIPESGLPGGYSATLIALACDATAMLGVWAMLSRLAGGRGTMQHPDELCGLLRENPLAGGVLSLCLLSLCGAPFLAGFWGRFWTVTDLFAPRQASSLTGLYEAHFGFLLLLAVSVAAQLLLCALYLRLLQRIVLEHPLGRIRTEGETSALACAMLLAGAVVVVGLMPAPLIWAVMPGSAAEEGSPVAPNPVAPDANEPSTPPLGGSGGQAVRMEDALGLPTG